ncbi:hypothetical protein WBJ53_12815 [Spirosoma sp. SC4-14]|uniref:hypothetical protein n=1 Tax=Spirosoma sp. SC4-14 TaxID=3128900 RepID=UPI0030CA9B62
MDKRTDSQLQEWLDKQVRAKQRTESLNESDEDFLLYKRLFTELSNEPAHSLSHSFAPNVIRQIQQRSLARREARLFLFYGLGLSLTLILTGSILFAAQNEALTALQQAFSRLGIPILFGLLLVALIQGADYYLLNRVRKRSLGHSMP